MSYRPPPQLIEMMESLCEGDLDIEDRQQLASLLAVGAEAQRFFVDYIGLHSTAVWNAAELFGPEEGSRDEAPSKASSQCFLPDEDFSVRRTRSLSWMPWYIAGVGTACALAMSVFLYRSSDPPQLPHRHASRHAAVASGSSTAAPAALRAGASFVGLLTETDDVQWGAESVTCETGQLLPAGTFHLMSGAISIDLFGGGALSTIGPARFSLNDHQSLTIHSGRLMISVFGDRAELSVETPAAEFLHIGTQFCVSVRPDGTSDLTVLEGAVEVHPRIRNATYGAAQLVRAGNGFRIDPNGRYESLPEDFEASASNWPRLPHLAMEPPPVPRITRAGFSVRYLRADPNENLALLELELADRLLAGEFRIAEGVTSRDIDAIDFEERGDTEGSTNLFALDGVFPGDAEGAVDLDDGFAIQATAIMTVSAPWVYSFLTNSDDGVRLRIDGQDVIVDDGFHRPTISIASVPLEQGEHFVELTYYDLHRGARIELGVASGRCRDSSQFVPLRASDAE